MWGWLEAVWDGLCWFAEAEAAGAYIMYLWLTGQLGG